MKRLLATFVLTGVMGGSLLLAPEAKAQMAVQNMFDRLERVSEIYEQPDLENQDTRGILVQRIARVIGIFLSFLALLMVILIIYGGYLWMTARGNESQVDDAKHTIRSAIIGAIVILTSYALTGFIVYNVTRALRD